MRVVESTIYHFDELEEGAKERARQWYREASAGDNFFAEHVIEDAATIGALMGIDLRTRPVKLMGGGTRLDPCVYYSGFCSQGDGACFEANYSYAKGGLKKVREYAPQDITLHRIAEDLQEAQRRAFYRLSATTRHRGRYYHSGCMDISVHDCPTAEIEEEIEEALRDFADWIYRRLESEYDFTMSDESVDETIRANEYEFTEEGAIA